LPIEVPKIVRFLPIGTCWPFAGDVIFTACNFTEGPCGCNGDGEGDDEDGDTCCAYTSVLLAKDAAKKSPKANATIIVMWFIAIIWYAYLYEFKNLMLNIIIRILILSILYES
jgi:hypothetical protein